MKKLALVALTTLITLSAALPSLAASNPLYPQDCTWGYTTQIAKDCGNGGGGGGGGGGGD
jgi:hypothetical protein